MDCVKGRVTSLGGVFTIHCTWTLTGLHKCTVRWCCSCTEWEGSDHLLHKEDSKPDSKRSFLSPEVNKMSQAGDHLLLCGEWVVVCTVVHKQWLTTVYLSSSVPSSE